MYLSRPLERLRVRTVRESGMAWAAGPGRGCDRSLYIIWYARARGPAGLLPGGRRQQPELAWGRHGSATALAAAPVCCGSSAVLLQLRLRVRLGLNSVGPSCRLGATRERREMARRPRTHGYRSHGRACFAVAAVTGSTGTGPGHHDDRETHYRDHGRSHRIALESSSSQLSIQVPRMTRRDHPSHALLVR